MSHLQFVVFTSARTGSTWLIDRLNRQPGVEAHGELFLNQIRMKAGIAGRVDFPRFCESNESKSPVRVYRVFSYLNALYRGPGIVGFKLMYKQLRRYPEIFAYVAVRRVRLVHLTRSNVIDVLVSDEVARATGKSHEAAGPHQLVPAIRLEPTTLISRLERLKSTRERARSLLQLAPCPVLEVTYEALVDGRPEFESVLDFLRIAQPASDVGSVLAKRGHRSHRDSIANYEEVKQLIGPTEFSSMLR